MTTPTDPIAYCESLFAGLLSTAFDDTPFEGQVAVITGMNDTQRTIPCVIVYASNAAVPPELPDWLRNYEVDLGILILSQAHIPPPPSTEPIKGLADHRTLVQTVLNRLRNTPAVKSAAAAQGHMVYEVVPKAGQPELEESKFGTEITMTVTLVLDLPQG